MSAEIAITGIRAHAHHGVFEQERAEGQAFSVDLVLTVDADRAIASDDLDAAVDYGAVAVVAHDILTGDPCNLIEVVAARIADAVRVLPGVLAVRVTVHKPQAPIPVPFDDVTVTVVR